VDEISEYATWQYMYPWFEAEGAKLGIGSLIWELVEAIKGHVAGTVPYDLMWYSGHDSTIAPLTAAMGISDGYWPPYASYVLLEVWTSKDDPSDRYLRTIYNGKVVQVPGCPDDDADMLCPVDTFYTALAPVTLSLSDHFTECNKVSPPPPTPTTLAPAVIARDKAGFTVGIVIGVIGVAIGVAGVVYGLMMRKRLGARAVSYATIESDPRNRPPKSRRGD